MIFIEVQDLFSILNEYSPTHKSELLATIDDKVLKSNQYLVNLHREINKKTDHIKELDLLLKQENDRRREIETKLKTILELREHDTHLHVRQLGRVNVELCKAKTDAERIHILKQQIVFKQ